MLQRYIFLFFMTVFIASCATRQELPTAPIPASHAPTAAAVNPTIAPLTPTPEKVFVPKQNDLIFIEFFAVT
ncbi:MAG TPA: hypothetical protein VFR47_15530 [Anaerolineales bacterium]|nr:hypothetical protein [Anaerolineales bacterium]